MRKEWILILLIIGLLISARGVSAQVSVIREGDENPVLTIAKSTFWGGMTGLILGGAVALVVENNEDDVVKWFFVGGVFGGFGFGVYHVMNRERPSSGLIQMDGDRLALAFPTVTFKQDRDTGLKTMVTLYSLSF